MKEKDYTYSKNKFSHSIMVWHNICNKVKRETSEKQENAILRLAVKRIRMGWL